MERVKGIEPSSQNSESSQKQPLPTLPQADCTQGRAQIPDAASPDLAKVVAAWAELSSPLKAAILAIVNSSEGQPMNSNPLQQFPRGVLPVAGNPTKPAEIERIKNDS
jgi:hypothetical protein